MVTPSSTFCVNGFMNVDLPHRAEEGLSKRICCNTSVGYAHAYLTVVMCCKKHIGNLTYLNQLGGCNYVSISY